MRKLIIVLFALLVIIFSISLQGCGDECDEKNMSRCDSASDCIPVECGCSCSGCGGFGYDEIVNKSCEDKWYKNQNCSPSAFCPDVCCPGEMTIECENKTCVVK